MRAAKLAAMAAPLALALTTFAPDAHGHELPAFTSLPTGQLTALPRAKAPAFVSGNERVPGIFVVSPKHGPETPAESRYVSIVGDKKAADGISSGKGFDREERESGACFAEAHRSMRMMMGMDGDDDDAEDREWTTSQGWETNLWPRGRNNPEAGVTAVHSERIVEENGRVSLETIDAWVDPATRGARLIAKASLPLSLVGSAVGGIKVYAGRDERPGAKKYLQFVVVRRGGSENVSRSSMIGQRQDGTGVHGNGCGHLRMALAVEPRSGDSGVVMASVELPARDEASDDARDAKSKDGSASASDERSATTTATATTASTAPPPATSTRLPSKRRILGPKGLVKQVKVEMGAAAPKEREARVRDMQIHLSVSQTSRDREPVATVSFGWAGRESVQRVFEASREPAQSE